MAKNDFAGYGAAQKRLQDDIAKALAAQKQLGATSSGAGNGEADALTDEMIAQRGRGGPDLRRPGRAG